MSLFGRSQSKTDAASQSTTKMTVKSVRKNAPILPKAKSPQALTKSVRLRNATNRIHEIKKSVGSHTDASHRVAPGGKVQPKVAAPAVPQKNISDVITTERKVRTSTKNKQLGQLLLKNGKITDAQLTKALKIHEEKGLLLGQALVDSGACSKSDVAAILKMQRTITTVNLVTAHFDAEAVALLDRAFCEKHKVVPFELCGNQLCVAMSNALDTTTKNEIKEKTQQHVKIFDASNVDIQNAIKRYFVENVAAPAKPSLLDEAKKEEVTETNGLVIELPEDGARPQTPQAAAPAEPAAAAPASEPVTEAEEVLEIVPETGIHEDAGVGGVPVVTADAATEAPQAAETVEEISAVKEPESQSDSVEPLTEVGAVSPVKGGDMPSIAENLENMDLDELSHLKKSFLDSNALTAIPVSADYVRKISVDGSISVEQRWLLSVRATQPLPAIPYLLK